MPYLLDELGQPVLDEYSQLVYDEFGPPGTLPPRPPETVFVLEQEVYQPGGPAQPFALGRGTHPRGALTMRAQQLESVDTLRASDRGYRSRASDVGGLRVYPPVLDQAFEADRHLGLDPSSPSTATFGTVRLVNAGRRYDAYVQGRNTDSRPVRLLSGDKRFDASRGIVVDPAYADLRPVFGGFSAPWQLSEAELTIPLRDATYWADRPLQSSLYLGTGGLHGGADLAGKPVPITRGGTPAHPVQNVPLVLVDRVALIYQYTDAPGTVVTLYEGGAAVYAYDGDVPDLYAGMPPAPGHYRTCNTLGLLQLGSPTYGSRALTADVTGAFSAAGAVTTAAALARYLLTETIGLPAGMLDIGTVVASDAAAPWTAGIYIGTDPVSGLAVVQSLIGAIGARLIPTRGGVLEVRLLWALAGVEAPAARLSPLNVVDVTPAALPTTLDPPPYRWRVGFARNWAGSGGDLNGAITDDRRAFLGSPYRYATWSGNDVLTAWRRPSDPPAVETPLLVRTDAESLANILGALWRVRPGLYAVEMPIDTAAGLDLGQIVLLDWPLADLSGGKLGRIVGEQVRSHDGTATLSVLVGSGNLGAWDSSFTWDQTTWA